jgi:uncharacterized protein YndB with AHSA1/START domain
MDIDRNAPATAQGELEIDADPSTVFSVIAAIDQWPSWNPNVKSVTLQGPVQQGTVFRWKSGPSTLTSTLQVVDPPREIAWTGRTMASRPCTCSGSRPTTAARWRVPRSPGRACWARLLKGYSCKTLDKEIRSVLSHLKAEAERRAAPA